MEKKINVEQRLVTTSQFPVNMVNNYLHIPIHQVADVLEKHGILAAWD